MDMFGIHTNSESVLMPGVEFNDRITSLAGGPDRVHAIEWKDGQIPLNGDRIEIQSAGKPVYAWMDGDTLCLSSEAKTVYMSPLADCMFCGMDHLTKIRGLARLDASHVTGMESIFRGCRALQDLNGLENWKIMSVEDMNHAFADCSSLINTDALKDWKVLSVKDLNCMFQNCSSLTDLNGLARWSGRWAVGKTIRQSGGVETMAGMFSNCNSLKTLDGLDGWGEDMGGVQVLGVMFAGCKSLVDLSALENWDVSGAWLLVGMFQGCSSLTSLKGLENWRFQQIHSAQFRIEDMFRDCVSLRDISALRESGLTTDAKRLKETLFPGCPNIDYRMIQPPRRGLLAKIFR